MVAKSLWYQRLSRPFHLANVAPLGVVALVGLLALLTACRSFQAEAPAGFAPYDQKKSFRAVSPDGVLYRVRQQENKPKATLAFWKEALKKRMLDAGYHFVSEGDIKADNEPGYLLELNAPLGSQDYTYFIAVFARDNTLVIVESAGEVTRFKARREGVLAAIQKLRF